MKSHMRTICLTAMALTLAALPAPAGAQSVVFRVQINIPSGGSYAVQTAPSDSSFSLADRSALQEMWSGVQGQLEPAVRECQIPIRAELDAGSFRGQLVAGTMDGLHPGTRSRFQSVTRALTAVCRRGDMERGAVQGRIRAVRLGFTTSATDTATLEGDTLVFYTNGDLTDTGHQGYSQAIDFIMRSL